MAVAAELEKYQDVPKISARPFSEESINKDLESALKINGPIVEN